MARVSNNWPGRECFWHSLQVRATPAGQLQQLGVAGTEVLTHSSVGAGGHSCGCRGLGPRQSRGGDVWGGYMYILRAGWPGLRGQHNRTRLGGH